MIYIIPDSQDKPIKIVTEGETLEDKFAKYFEDITGYKADKVEWSENGMSLEASAKIPIEDLSNNKIGIITLE